MMKHLYFIVPGANGIPHDIFDGFHAALISGKYPKKIIVSGSKAIPYFRYIRERVHPIKTLYKDFSDNMDWNDSSTILIIDGAEAFKAFTKNNTYEEATKTDTTFLYLLNVESSQSTILMTT